MEIEIIEMPENKVVYGDVHPFSEEGFELFKAWLSENDVYYYGKCKEDFSKVEAYNLAAEAGKSKLILDNLS